MNLTIKCIKALNVFFVTLSCFVLSFNLKSNEAGFFNQIQSTPVQFESIYSQNNPSIVDSYVHIWGNNIYHVSQQEGSLLMPFVKMEGMVMNAKQINRIGTLNDPQLYQARGSKVVATNPKQDNRWLTAQRYWLACFVDNYDQIRTLWDIKNAYSEAMAMSFGRLYDRVIIQAALGTVWTGPNRTNTVSLPLSQRYAAFKTTTPGDLNTPMGLNLDTLMAIRLRMKKTFATKRGQSIVVAITADETDSMLQETQMTNRDYTSVLTLMSGEISAFYGFVFVETELIPANQEIFYYDVKTGKGADSSYKVGGTGTVLVSNAASTPNTSGGRRGTIAVGAAHRCFAFMSGDSLCFGINQNILARVSERNDLHYNWQLYYAAEFGAVRKEEVKVIEILTRNTDVA